LLGLDKDPPPGISLYWLDESQTLDVMLNEGQIDGAWGFAPHYDRGTENFKNIDRYGGTPIIGNARIRRPFLTVAEALLPTITRRPELFRSTTWWS
jgi:hypothetical protein